MWAVKGVKGREDEWVDTAHVAWSEVTGLCVFWDGSCDEGKCGAGLVSQPSTKTLGWVHVHKKKMWAGNASEFPGCRIWRLWHVVEKFASWIDKSMREQRTRIIAVDVSLLYSCIFRCAVHANRPLPSPSNPGLWLEGGLWLRCPRLDIDSIVASRLKQVLVDGRSQAMERHALPLCVMEGILYGSV